MAFGQNRQILHQPEDAVEALVILGIAFALEGRGPVRALLCGQLHAGDDLQALRQRWTLTPTVRGALDLLEASRAHGLPNLDDAVRQVGLLGAQEYTPRVVALAKQLQSAKPLDLAQAVRTYAQDARFASEGSGLFGSAPTPQESFEKAFPSKPETGPFGPISREFSGKPQEALAWVRGQKNGFAAAAIPHPETQRGIGLPFGWPGKEAPEWEGGFGVSHIDAKHEGWLDQHVGEISGWPVVERYVDKAGHVNRMILSNGRDRVAVSADWKGTPHEEWLLSGYLPEK